MGGVSLLRCLCPEAADKVTLKYDFEVGQVLEGT